MNSFYESQRRCQCVHRQFVSPLCVYPERTQHVKDYMQLGKKQLLQELNNAFLNDFHRHWNPEHHESTLKFDLCS